jgi:hypothetical protein
LASIAAREVRARLKGLLSSYLTLITEERQKVKLGNGVEEHDYRTATMLQAGTETRVTITLKHNICFAI